jgi:phenylacetate-coenzyme A ligase PaaK-like adenylate-forming protein
MIKILHNLALFWIKNAIFSAEFFAENILKIITSVPGASVVKIYTATNNIGRF